ncbi:MAG: nucleoside monophosphate kinase [Xanthomonadales bacterium]|nr:nucleoside monophosphate kinase [Xanthomonadales bacterium]
MKIPYIVVFGHNASGKSTFTKKLLNQFKLNRVNGDIVRDLIIENTNYYSDINYSYFTEKAASMNRVTDNFRLSLLKELIDNKAPILIDGSSVARRTRTRYLDLVKDNNNYVTIIIEISIPEKELISRLKERDENNKDHQWLNQYIEKKKAMYEPVNKTESNYYLKYTQDNFEEVVKELNIIVPEFKK